MIPDELNTRVDSTRPDFLERSLTVSCINGDGLLSASDVRRFERRSGMNKAQREYNPPGVTGKIPRSMGNPSARTKPNVSLARVNHNNIMTDNYPSRIGTPKILLMITQVSLPHFSGEARRVRAPLIVPRKQDPPLRAAASWLRSADLDGNGVVTISELLTLHHRPGCGRRAYFISPDNHVGTTKLLL